MASFKSGKLFGFALNLISCLLYTIGDFVYKHACIDLKYYVVDIIIIRSFTFIIISTIANRIHPSEPLTKPDYSFIIIRTTLLILTTACFSIGLLFLNVSTAYIIYSLAPIITLIISPFYLNERFSLFNMIATLFSFMGLVIIIKPPIFTSEPKPISFYFASLLFMVCAVATAYLCILQRKIKASLNIFMLSYYYGIALSMVAGTVLFFRQRDPSIIQFGVKDWVLCIFIGALLLLSDILYYYSFKYEEAGVLSIVMYTEIVYSFLYEVAFLGIIPDLITAMGALMIVGGSISVALHKLLHTTDQTLSPIRDARRGTIEIKNDENLYKSLNST